MKHVRWHMSHASNRGSERYGLELRSEEYAAISARIAFHALTAEQELVRLCPAGEGRERWAVWFKGEWLPVVFDTGTARIVTILPKNELRRHRHKLPW